jgi:hypothetical protein
MRKLFFIILFFIIIILFCNTKIERFNNKIQKYNSNINYEIKNENNYNLMVNLINNIDIDLINLDNTQKISINLNNTNKNSFNYDNLLNLIITAFLIEGNVNKNITKTELKKLIYNYFGPYAIIKNNSVNEGNITINLPIHIIQKKNLENINNLFRDDENINFQKILELKKKLIVNKYTNNIKPIKRKIKNNDKIINYYNNNYNKLVNNKNITNWSPLEEKNNYFHYNYDNKADNIINTINNNENLDDFYSKNTTIQNVINNNTYPPNKKCLKWLKNKNKNNIDYNNKLIKKNPLPKDWTYDNLYKLSIPEEYPSRYKLPLENNCNRIWYNCNSVDRINDYYKYYK